MKQRHSQNAVVEIVRKETTAPKCRDESARNGNCGTILQGLENATLAFMDSQKNILYDFSKFRRFLFCANEVNCEIVKFLGRLLGVGTHDTSETGWSQTSKTFYGCGKAWKTQGFFLLYFVAAL